MKTIKIQFADWYPGFENEDSESMKILKKRYKVELSDTPDFVICGVYGETMSKYALKYDCVRILFTGESVSPDFNRYDYAVGFDDMSFGDRYFRMPLCNLVFNDRIKSLVDQRKDFDKEDLKKKDLFASFVCSNRYGQKERETMFNIMSSYKFVASAGGFLNNMNGERCKDKIEFQSRSKFVIAFENGIYDGYSTEKIIHAFASKAIPVYYGNPSICRDFNEDSFINCHKYDSFDDVLKEIIRLDNDDDAYIEMLRKNPFAYDFEARFVEYKEFLYSIFDREPKDALRRNRSLFGKRLENAEKKKIQCYPLSHIYSNRITDRIHEIRYRKKERPNGNEKKG